MRPDLDSSKPGRGFFVSYGHEVFFRHKAPLTGRGGHALARIAGHLRGEAKSIKGKKRTLKKQCPFISCVFCRTVRGALCLKKTYGVWGGKPQSLHTASQTPITGDKYNAWPLIAVARHCTFWRGVL